MEQGLPAYTIDHGIRNPLVFSLNPMSFLLALRFSISLPKQISKICNFILYRPWIFAWFKHIGTIADPAFACYGVFTP